MTDLKKKITDELTQLQVQNEIQKNYIGSALKNSESLSGSSIFKINMPKKSNSYLLQPEL